MIAFLKTALGLGSGVSWIVYAVVFGLGLAIGGAATWRVMQWHVNEVVAQRDEAKTKDAYHEADAGRWAAASDLRDKSIAMLADQLNAQSAAAESQRVKADQLRTDLDQARAENDKLAAEHDALSQALAEEAKSAPGDVRAVGPIVARRAPALFE